MRLSVTLAVTLAVIGFASSDAYAAPTPAPPPDVPTVPVPADRFRPLALTANPFSLLFTRFGINVEYLPVVHHAIVVNPNVGRWSFGPGDILTVTELGGELGYRYYLGTRGANGVFVGPSVVYTHYSFDIASLGGISLDAIGGAVDLGGQLVAKNGFTMGAGVGVMYKASLDSWWTSKTALGINRVEPRLLVTMGYSF